MTLLRRALLAGAVVASSVGLLVPVPTAAEAVLVRDPVGDATLAGGDLRSAGAVFQAGNVLFSATVKGPNENPFGDGPWADPATVITWTLSGAGGEDLYRVTFRTERPSGSVGLSSVVTRVSDGTQACLGTPSTDWGTYRSTVPASCIPGFARYRATMTWRDGGTTSVDSVPDSGSSAPVLESGAPTGSGVVPADVRLGYWAVSENGVVYALGDVRHLNDISGSMPAESPTLPLPRSTAPAKALDIDVAVRGRGYWILTSNGQGWNCTAADLTCSNVIIPPPEPTEAPAPGQVVIGKPVTPIPVQTSGLAGTPVSLSVTPTGNGLWIFSSRGEVVPFGDAKSFGNLASVRLKAPIVDSVATPSGQGYYMIAADGGVFTFGDAAFAGSMGNRNLNKPVRSLVADGDGAGYWLVASDGGIFAFDAPFLGSMGSTRLNRPVRGMIRYGDGYLMVAEDGGIFNFSSLPFSGSLGASPPGSPVVSVTALAI
jgi:hypothetical protein